MFLFIPKTLHQRYIIFFVPGLQIFHRGVKSQYFGKKNRQTLTDIIILAKYTQLLVSDP